MNYALCVICNFLFSPSEETPLAIFRCPHVDVYCLFSGMGMASYLGNTDLVCLDDLSYAEWTSWDWIVLSHRVAPLLATDER